MSGPVNCHRDALSALYLPTGSDYLLHAVRVRHVCAASFRLRVDKKTMTARGNATRYAKILCGLPRERRATRPCRLLDPAPVYASCIVRCDVLSSYSRHLTTGARVSLIRKIARCGDRKHDEISPRGHTFAAFSKGQAHGARESHPIHDLQRRWKLARCPP
jgi:hypothetical protein